MKLALCLTCFVALGFAQSTPTRTVDSDCPFAPNQPVPFFRSGYCFRFDTALAYGPNGQLAFAARPQLPGDGQPSILDVAVDRNGGFVAAAVSTSARGLVLLDKYGVQKAFIPTKGFYPSHITVSEDHSIWVLVNTGWKPGEHPVVRRYSSSGKESVSFLPVSSFPAGTVDPGVGGRTAILSGGGVVAVVARSGSESNANGNLRELIRMDYSGKVLSRSRFDNVREQVLAMTSDGNLYRGDYVPGLPVYRFNSDAQLWEQVSKPAGVAALFGADGPNLVYHIFDGSERTRIQWYAQPADQKSELEIRTLLAEFAAARNAQDGHRMSQAYADDAMFSSFGGLPVVGRTAIERVWSRLAGRAERTVKDVRFIRTDSAVAQVDVNFAGPGGQTNFLEVMELVRKAGQWRIAVHQSFQPGQIHQNLLAIESLEEAR